MMKSGIKYVYNYKLANFLIEQGVTCVGTGINKGNIYWAFNYKDCQEAYEMWNNKSINC